MRPCLEQSLFARTTTREYGRGVAPDPAITDGPLWCYLGNFGNLCDTGDGNFDTVSNVDMRYWPGPEEKNFCWGLGS